MLTPLAAHDFFSTKITWSREISRIVYRRCAGCHRDGGPAPMALVQYDAVRPWAKAIADQVQARRMPPWDPVRGFGDFEDRSLTQEEINLIAEWVEGGAPPGEEKYLPELPPLPQDMPRKVAKRWPAHGLLNESLTIDGIEVRLKPGASLMVTAELPDGAVEPLVWIPRKTTAEPAAVYPYARPVALPKGTRIVTEGGGAGGASLVRLK
jgi:hypothetical protein